MGRSLRVVRDYIYPDDPSEGNEIDARLLRIYWHKKQLEDFLPGIARYSTPDEVCKISLAQLNIMERELIAALQEIARKNY